MTKTILAKNGEELLVDVKDFERVNEHVWKVNKSGTVTTRIDNKSVALPKFIWGKSDKKIGQKKQGLDFTRDNLTDKTELYKGPAKNSTSQYKGVYQLTNVSRKWFAEIAVKGRNIKLGEFNTEISAARAYNQAVYRYHNGEGYLNDVEL